MSTVLERPGKDAAAADDGPSGAGPVADDGAPRKHRRPRKPSAPLPWLWIAAIAIGQALVYQDVRVPLLRPLVAGAMLVGVPLVVLSRAWTRGPGNERVAFLFACGASVLALIVVPLALNTVLPWFGVDRPMDRPVLVAAWSVIDLALVIGYRRALRGTPETRARLRASLDAARLVRPDGCVALAAASVVLAVSGAVRLNNGLGGEVAVAGHWAAVLALGVTALRRRESRTRDVTVAYLAGLALLFGTSLRGWFITGHDIQNEYLAFLYTHNADHWVMSAYPTPYNACLSVNILPATVVEYTGLSGVFVFKVLMQVLFAVVPVCVYLTACRFTSGRVALLAVAVFVFFPTYYTDMPFLTRQEVAYFFAALALLAATQLVWTHRHRRIATYGFALGVILSHYATTYLLVITLLAGLSGVGAGRLARRFKAWRARPVRPVPVPRERKQPGRAKRRRGKLILAHPLIVTAVAITAWTWSSPLTHSGGHLAETVNSLAGALIKGDTTSGSSDLKYAVIFGKGPTEQERFADYVKDVSDRRAAVVKAEGRTGYVFPRVPPSLANPGVAERADLPLTGVGRAVQSSGVDVAKANAVARLGAAALLQVALGVGLLALLLVARRTRRFPRESFWLAFGSVAGLAAVAVVPGLSASYGILRAFQQTLIFTAPIVAIGLVTLLAPLRRAAVTAAAAVLGVVGLTLTGALPAVFGGYAAVLSQSNSGAYYEQLYTDPTQLAAAEWLGRDLRDRGFQSVTGGDIVAVTRLQMYLPRAVGTNSDLLPLQLRRGTYLVLGPQVVDEGTAGVFYTGDVLTFHYPTDAVEQRMNLVYSTPGNRVYR